MIVENDCTILQNVRMGGGEIPMDVINHAQAEREAQRVQTDREELVERMARAIGEDGTVETLPGGNLGRGSMTGGPVHGTVSPSFCAIAEESKEILLGESRYRYDPYHYLAAAS